MYNFLDGTNDIDEKLQKEFDEFKNSEANNKSNIDAQINNYNIDNGINNLHINNDNILDSELKKDTSSILYKAPFDVEKKMTEIQESNAKKTFETPLDKEHFENFKSGKNYLFTKEATKTIIQNYDDLVIKNEFVNYLIDNLTEYYMLDDYEYVNEFLFPEEQSSLTIDLIKTIIGQKRSLLFNYYMEQVFVVVDDITKEFNYIAGIKYILRVNPTLIPLDLKNFYGNNLKLFLVRMTIGELENYHKVIKKEFANHKNTNFENDFYRSYFIPSIKEKIVNEPIENIHKLKTICNLIIKYQELKYNRQSRILFTTYNMLSAKNNYYTYDEDIMYDVQNYVEEILMNDQILDYNLIYFVSYFDGAIDYRKSLNLVINILEGVKTISLSQTKYDLIKEQTIDESLSYLEWVLINHHRDTNSQEFREAVKDFTSFNWVFFTENNKSFLKLKSKLRNYAKLDEVIEEAKSQQEKGFKIWYMKNGSFAISMLLTILFFLTTCFLGISFLNSYLSSITSLFVIIMIILLEIVIAGFLVLIMVFDNNKK